MEKGNLSRKLTPPVLADLRYEPGVKCNKHRPQWMETTKPFYAEPTAETEAATEGR